MFEDAQDAGSTPATSTNLPLTQSSFCLKKNIDITSIICYYSPIMKSKRQDLNGDRGSVYVVTRGRRRIENCNYTTRQEASDRAQILLNMLKDWSPLEVRSVSIVHTADPGKIY